MQLVYSFLDNELPSDLRKLFILNDEIHTYHTRQVLHVPCADTLISFPMMYNTYRYLDHFYLREPIST